MTPEAQRIAIALACGWEHEIRKVYAGQKNFSGFGKNKHLGLGDQDRKFTRAYGLPNYPEDLNAMHEAEHTIDPESGAWKNYPKFLWQAMAGASTEYWGTIHATAAQRAEAFLRTIGRWKE